MVKLGKNHPFVASVPKQNRCATCNIRQQSYHVIHVYGTISKDLTVVDGQELVIDTSVIIDVGITLLIQRGAKLTITNTGRLSNNGTLTVNFGGLFVNEGNFTNGTLPLQQSQFSMNYSSSFSSNYYSSNYYSNFSLDKPMFSNNNTFNINNGIEQKYIDLNVETPAYEKYNFNKAIQYIIGEDLGPYFYKAISEDPTSIFNNSGTFFNSVNAECINAPNGIITNTGLINNVGTVNNTGTIDTSGILDNNNGQINNTGGTINNTGTVTNSGTGTIDGGTYTGPAPSGNPVIPPPPTSSILVGNAFNSKNSRESTIACLYWPNGNIYNAVTTQKLSNYISTSSLRSFANSISSKNLYIIGNYQDATQDATYNHGIIWLNPSSTPILLSENVLGLSITDTNTFMISDNGTLAVGIYRASSYNCACYWNFLGLPDSPGGILNALPLNNQDITPILNSYATCVNSTEDVIYGYINTYTSILTCKWIKTQGSFDSPFEIVGSNGNEFIPSGILPDGNTLYGISLSIGPPTICYLNMSNSEVKPITSIYTATIPTFGINTGSIFYGLGLTFVDGSLTATLIQIEGTTITPLAAPSYITNYDPSYDIVMVGYSN